MKRKEWTKNSIYFKKNSFFQRSNKFITSYIAFLVNAHYMNNCTIETFFYVLTFKIKEQREIRFSSWYFNFIQDIAL